MLTLQEIQSSTINLSVAREAYIQVDRHLLDILEVRKSFEQKAATLMGAYITISAMLAYLTFHHRDRIALSVMGNRRKARWIDAGIFLGPVAPVFFLILFLVL